MTAGQEIATFARERGMPLVFDDNLSIGDLWFPPDPKASGPDGNRPFWGAVRAARFADIEVRVMDAFVRVGRIRLPRGHRCEKTVSQCAGDFASMLDWSVTVDPRVADRPISVALGDEALASLAVGQAFERAGLSVQRRPGSFRIGLPPKNPSACSTTFGSGIRQLSPTRVEVSRTAVHCFHKAMEEASTRRPPALILPVDIAGHGAALKLLRVEPGTPLDQLGLRSGDIVQTVGGHSIASPEGALAIYTEMEKGTRSEIEVWLSRNNSRMKITYRIVPK